MISTLTKELIAINSANPATCHDGLGESRIAAFCCSWLSARGVPAEVVATKSIGRPSVLSVLSGSGGGRDLLLCGHLDTYTWYPPPENDNDRIIRGPGAYDMKGGIAAIMSVMAQLATSRRRGSVKAILVCDEEHSSLGARALAPSISAEAAIVVEGTGLTLGTSHNGRVRAFITVDNEVQRNDLLSKVFALSRRQSAHLRGLAFATSDVSVPTLVIQRAVLPGEDARTLGDRLSAEVARLVNSRPYWDIRESLSPEGNHILSEMLQRHSRNKGVDVFTRQLDGWTDAAVLAATGIPSVVFGPGGGGAHTDDEWVDLDQVDRTVEILCSVTEEFCR